MVFKAVAARGRAQARKTGATTGMYGKQFSGWNPRAGMLNAALHSHSMVPGGLEVMSYTTRLMPLISLTMRLEMVLSTSVGRGTQSAVMPSSECTARMAQV